ncbi:MAG: TetR/AcrR family transcriptional regulator [Myxococcota bacterium]
MAGPVDRPTRSRLAICNACLDLIQEGVLQPSADQVAARAGLSRRSVFNHFKDLAELYDAVARAAMERCAPLLETIPESLPLDERVARLAEVRSRFLEATAPFARALTAQSLVGLASVQARRISSEALDRQRSEIEALFAGELARLEEPERSETLDALAAAASAATWEYLRRHRELDPARARAVLARSLHGLLGRAGDD